MFYLADFARTKGAKDKKPRKRNSLKENIAITALPSIYSSYLFGQALQTGEKNYIRQKLKRTLLNIKEKEQWSSDRRQDYNDLLNLAKKKDLSYSNQRKLNKLEGYRKQTGDLFLSGRELTGLEKNRKALPNLQKKWKHIENIPVPKNWKEGLTPKLKYLTPSRLGITLLGGAGVSTLTGATLKYIRDRKKDK